MPDASAFEVLAYREACSVRTAWRMIYDMPPTDPRFLEATDDIIYDDLLVRAFFFARRNTPESVADADDPDAGQKYKERMRATLDRPEVAAILDKIRGKREQPPNMTINLNWEPV